MGSWRTHAPLVALGCLVVGVWVPLWSGESTLVVRDVAGYFHPMKALLADAVRAGEFPWWNPWIRNGLPFFANPEVGLFYPPSVAFYVLPTPLAYNWILILHGVLAATGFYTWLRIEERSRSAAAFGAAAIVLGGFGITLMNYLNFLQAFAWIGWTWWAWRRWLEAREARWLVLAAVGFALQFLAGEPQVPVLTAGVALAMAWVADFETTGRRRWIDPALALVLAAGTSLLLSAVQLIPTLELFLQSGRREGLAVAESLRWSAEPASLVQLLLPSYFDGPGGTFEFLRLPTAGAPWVFTSYLGASVVAVAFAAASGRRRRVVALWTGVASVGLFFALGENNSFVAALAQLPIGPSTFRYPEKLLVLPAIAIPTLAAFGLDALRKREPGARLRALLGCVVVAVSGAILYAVLSGGVVQDLVARRDALLPQASDPRWVIEALERARLHAVAVAGVTAVILLFRDRLRGEGIAIALAIVAVADLASVNLDATPVGPTEWVYGEPEVLRPLPEEDLALRYRVRTSPVVEDPMLVFVRAGASYWKQQRFLGRVMSPNRSMIHRVLAEDGAEAIRPIHDDWRSEILGKLPVELRVRYLRLASVAYLYEREGALEGVEGVTAGPSPVEGLALHRVEDPLPRAYLVQRAIVEPDSIAGINELLAGGRDPHVVAFVDRSPGLRGPRRRVDGSVEWIRSGNHTIELRTQAPDSTFLVLTDTAYPGWSATVDGARRDLVRANWHFKGVYLAPGEHLVRFAYRPRGVLAGAVVSLLTLLVSAIVIVGGGRRET